MSRRRRIASAAPRTLPRKKKKDAPYRMDTFEIRAAAQTQLLRNPGLSLRELALSIGQPYIRVRDALHGEGSTGTGLSQYRWPEVPEEATG